MSIEVKSIIDGEIVITEQVDDNLYEYINNIVQKYSLMSLVIYINLNIAGLSIEIKFYDNTG